MRLRLLFLTVVITIAHSFASTCYAQAGEQEMATIAKQIAEQLVAKQRAKVTALDFTDLQGRPNELGRYLAEQLAVELVSMKGMTVLNRANIASIMAEHQLTAEGLVKPENAKKLGQFSGVETIVIGNLVTMGDNVMLTVKGISTETAEVVAAGRARIPVTKEIQHMLGQSVSGGGNSNSAVNGRTEVSATEGEAIATRDLGPIQVVLRNVAQYTLPSERGSIPAIRCTFDIENPNLQRFVALAANQRQAGGDQAQSIKAGGYRGDVVDSNQVHWRLVEAKGVPAVFCFEAKNLGAPGVAQWSQRNPGSIVDYIRTATKYDEKASESDRYWSGSLGSITPGKSVRLTVDFVPAEVAEHEDRSRQRAEKPKAWSRPEYFQFDMELVIGTFVEGEDSIKAKDLTLRNLTIDRVVLPKDPKTREP